MRSVKNKKFKINSGYTLMELLVSIAVILAMLSIVLANFRAGQGSSDVKMTINQVVSDINKTKNWAQAGRVDQTGNYPFGGYLVRFFYRYPKNYYIATSSAEFINSSSSRFSSSNLVQNGQITLKNYKFIQFCGLDNSIVDLEETGLPCDDTKITKWKNIQWQVMTDFLEIGFNQPNLMIVNYPGYLSSDNFKYIGGIIQDVNTLEKGYFYISLISGLTSSGKL